MLRFYLMVAWLITLLAAQPAPAILPFSARPSLVIVVQLPTGKSVFTTVGQLVESMERELDEFSLGIVLRDDDITRGCKGEVPCLRRRARAGGDLGCLLIVSIVAVEQDSDEVTALAIDLHAEDGALLQTEPQTVGSPAEMEDWIRRIVGASLMPLLRERKLVVDVGTIEIVGSGRPQIELDGAILGAASPPQTLVTMVPAGEHLLRLQHAGEPAEERTIAVRANETVRIQPAQSEPPSVWKTTLLYGGASVAVAGAVLTAWAAIFSIQHGGDGSACVAMDTEACIPQNRFWSLARVFSGSASVDRGGVLALPLGVSLLVTGSAWVLGSLLFEDDLPWLQLLVGLGAGAILYGAGQLAN